MYIYIYIYTYYDIISYNRESVRCNSRKTDSIHHHHPEGVVYRSCCFDSSTFAVSEIASRRQWCIESIFPYGQV